MLNLPPFPDNTPSDWKGMTLREIQMRRMLVQARMEIEKYRMDISLTRLRDNNPLTKFGSFTSRLAGAFSIAEYIFFGIKAIKWIWPFFRSKK